MTQRIILAGSSGLIGRALAEKLRECGAEVHHLVRRETRNSREHMWSPETGMLELEVLAGADALVSLNGASVGHLPWSASYRRALRDSRLDSTRTLMRAVQQLGSEAPKAWLSGSAVGYYGDRPGETMTEASNAGETFLARLCVEWEQQALEATGTQVALLRTAPVIHPQGVLKPMITLTKLGLGGPLAGGKQIWPWISLADEVRGILHVLDRGLRGPINLTGPTLSSAHDIGSALARQLRRPFLIPAPQFALNITLGKDATESLLTSDAAVLPEALLQSGFEFVHTTPDAAIRDALGAELERGRT